MKHTTIDLETGEVIERDWTADEIADAQERAWRTLRATRNELLASSDWTVLGDSPTSTAAWKTYRQALRDLPANTTDPFNVVWPTPPA
jgi:hypothetical protein